MPMRQGTAVLVTAAAIFSLVLSVPARAEAPPSWTGSWASSQMLPAGHDAVDTDDLDNATLRQIVHLTLGGKTIRVRLSNAFGSAPLHIAAAHVAIPLSPLTGSVDVSTDHTLTFAGRTDVTIPAGAEYISDPLEFPVSAFSDLAISIYLDKEPEQETGHPGAHQTSFLLKGNQVSSVDLVNATQFEHWLMISGVDVATPPQAATVVALGDSITDGHGSTTNGDDRWPDDLARRFQHSPMTQYVSVLNAGIGGNRVLIDGTGPNVLARFDRDVLAQTGVRYVILLEGINDLGNLTKDKDAPAAAHQEMVRNIIAAYGQIIARAHAHGIQVMGATITPFMGSDYYHPTAANDGDRQAINEWIRAPGHFDAVADFDMAVRDPAQPDRLLPLYDCGDHLHPSPAGYRVMADAVPLSFFALPPPPAPEPVPAARPLQPAKTKAVKPRQAP